MLSVVFASLLCQQPTVAQNVGFGHSSHGSAYDQGLRTKPWKIEGIGNVHMPITAKTPEVQMWFDQGVALLHSFWYEEAERSFRWCLKLDPKCAMAYWGLAQCRSDLTTEIDKAVPLEDGISDREKMYIEAWAKNPYTNAGQPTDYGRKSVGTPLMLAISKIIAKYPDDIEAKAQYAWLAQGSDSSYSVQAIIDQILAVNPLHPGALHAAIHNWDYSDPVQALEFCRRYSLAAPGIGHAQHMPGHNYSKIGMWHEAARAMDIATRVELRYMNERLALPEDVWNFPHNRTYLGYIQEQLGMIKLSVQGARDMLASPAARTPQDEKVSRSNDYYFGLSNLVRALAKAERWDEIVKPGAIPWPTDPHAQTEKLAIEATAYAHLGKPKEARKSYDQLVTLSKPKPGEEQKKDAGDSQMQEDAEGWVLISEGDRLGGIRKLLDAAVDQDKRRSSGPPSGDPPTEVGPIMREVGDAYLQFRDPQLAIDAYEKSLAYLPNDGYSLAGLARAWASKGDREKAAYYAGRLAYVWSKADSDLKPLVAVRSLGLKATPIAETPAPEHAYDPAELARFGPSNWQPYQAPALDCLTTTGKPVTLEDYRGKNVILVFYLSDECVHCVEQLQSLDEMSSELKSENTVVLAVSAATPAANKKSLKVGSLKVTLLSDTPNHDTARRYSSYDDFEDMELHSTILIDPQGRVRWKKTGGDPFKDTAFLLKEIQRFDAHKIADAEGKSSPLAKSKFRKK